MAQATRDFDHGDFAPLAADEIPEAQRVAETDGTAWTDRERRLMVRVALTQMAGLDTVLQGLADAGVEEAEAIRRRLYGLARDYMQAVGTGFWGSGAAERESLRTEG